MSKTAKNESIPKEEIREIIFHKTGNFLIDNGIIALEYYLSLLKEEAEYEESIEQLEFDYRLTPNALEVNCNSQKTLFELLELAYYKMGREVYDTTNQLNENEYSNAYYDQEKDEFIKFPGMKTYGLAALITNDAAGKTKNPDHTVRISVLEKENPDMVKKFEDFFEVSGLKLQKQLYFNEPYTKTTRFDLEAKHLQPGENTCYLSNEKFQKLTDLVCATPFSDFGSFRSLRFSDKEISWKVSYITRFAPRVAYYNYVKGLDSLNVFMFEGNNLLQLKKLFNVNQELFLPEQIKQTNKHLNNVCLSDSIAKTGLTGLYDNLFGLIYTFYDRVLKAQLIKNGQERVSDPFSALDMEHQPISLVYLKADKFSATMRPCYFEYLNDFKFQVRLIYHLEMEGMDFRKLLSNLTIKFKESDDYSAERRLRNKILEAILNLRPILGMIEILFDRAFRQLTAGSTNRRYYAQILKLLNFYEPIIQYGGNKAMTEELQQRAIKLGISIGKGILEHDPDGNEKDNAKAGRSNVIALRKARNQKQFLDEITRIQFKYNIIIARDILDSINEQNWLPIKQFTLISALNIINSAIQPKQNTLKTEKPTA